MLIKTSILLVTHSIGSMSTKAASTLPQYSIQHNIQRIISQPTQHKQWPFTQQDLRRADETSDQHWYSQPRFVTHIDDQCIQALSNVYFQVFQDNDSVLDLCSSWISHFPVNQPTLSNVVGLGMNEQELARNPILNSFVVKDLNLEPKLPFEDNSFDKITNAVSVDYLSKPQEIFVEMHRVLKPGGLAIMAWSNRMFPTKVVDMWLKVSEEERVKIVQSYFLLCGAPFVDVVGYQMVTLGTDPLYVVVGRKRTQQEEKEFIIPKVEDDKSSL